MQSSKHFHVFHHITISMHYQQMSKDHAPLGVVFVIPVIVISTVFVLLDF